MAGLADVADVAALADVPAVADDGSAMAEVHPHPLEGHRDVVEAPGFGEMPGPAKQPVDLAVGVGRVVVEQEEPPDPALGRHPDGIGDGRVAPVGLLHELLVGVLGIVDQDVGTVAELEDSLGDPLSVEGGLVVRQVDQDLPLGLDPKSEGVPPMGHRPRHDLDRSDREVLVIGVDEADLTPEVGHVDREERWLYGRGQGLLEGAPFLARTVDGEDRAGVVEGGEEGQPQDVVEVEMAEESRRCQRPALGPESRHQRVAEGADPGAEVQDERLLVGPGHQRARGVATDPAVAVPGTRAGAADPVEGDLHTLTVPPPDGALRLSLVDAAAMPPLAEVEANGVRFAYLEDGPPDGPLALCLHGFPDTAYTWRYLLKDLAGAGYHAVAPFMRGYAPTSLAPDGRYQTGALSKDANSLHEALGGTADAVLIGHDWGALAAYGAAAHQPDRWRRVVTAAVPPTQSIMSSFFTYDQLRRSWYTFFFQSPLAEIALPLDGYSFIDRLWADWSPGYDPTWDVARVKESIGAPERIVAAITYYRDLYDQTRHDPVLAEEQDATLSPMPQPSLYIHGIDDGCFAIDAIGDPLEHLAEGSETAYVTDAGHFVQVEQPDEFAGATLSFLDG